MNKNYLLLFCIIFLVSCGQKESSERIITVTIEPQRYFAEQLVDSLFEVHTMVPPGVSPETYDPSPVEMTKLSASEIYFRIGSIGFETAWMDKIIENNPDLKVFDNSKGVAYIVSGENEHYEGKHEHEETHFHGHDGIDPHIWTSPKQVCLIVENMYDALVEVDKFNEEIYTRNLAKIERKITETDSIVTALIDHSKNKSFIIYHPSLTYFARDYGLTQYCIEIGGKEPTPVQLKQLIEVSRIKNIKTIFIQKEFDEKNAEIIAKETGCKLVSIDPLNYHWHEEMIRIAKALANE